MKTTAARILLVPAFTAFLSAATVSSPNGRITVTVDVKENLEPYPAGKRLYYSVAFDGKPLLADSPFRLDFKGMPPIARDLAVTGEKRRAIDETWQPVWGTRKQIRNRANELTLSLEETGAPKRKLEFIVRASDDGVGVPLRAAPTSRPPRVQARRRAQRIPLHRQQDGLGGELRELLRPPGNRVRQDRRSTRSGRETSSGARCWCRRDRHGWRSRKPT